MSDSPAYQVLARKYRPQTFADLIGQETMVRTLRNAFGANRIAHAFVMTGVRGVGKTTTARIIAKGLNCTGPAGAGGPTIEPCGDCGPCRLHNGECDPPLLLSVAIHRDLIGCADSGVEGDLAGCGRGDIIVLHNQREVSHTAAGINSEHRIEGTPHERNNHRSGSRRRP